jgi:hypothetical protein
MEHRIQKTFGQDGLPWVAEENQIVFVRLIITLKGILPVIPKGGVHGYRITYNLNERR